MKSNYYVRAERFLKSIFPYIADEDIFNVEEVKNGVECYNREKHRKVEVYHGATRIALITSDYVIKWDYDEENIDTWGGCESECNFYEYAENSGYGYLFAEATRFVYDGIMFCIMPRINMNNYWHSFNEFCNPTEYHWIVNHVGDLHNGNWGIYKGKLKIIDYANNEYQA